MPPPPAPQPPPMPMPVSMPALRTRTLTGVDLDPDDPTADNLVNMYFLILAAFVILMMCSLWYWRRNKRSKALASLGVRRTALVADLELRRRRDNRGGGGGGGGGIGIGGEGDGEAPPPYVQRPERARGGLPKYEEVVEGGPTEEEVERVRRSVERGTRARTSVEGEGDGQERQQQQQQQSVAEGEDETARERTGGGGGLVPGDSGGTERERAVSTSVPTPI